MPLPFFMVCFSSTFFIMPVMNSSKICSENVFPASKMQYKVKAHTWLVGNYFIPASEEIFITVKKYRTFQTSWRYHLSVMSSHFCAFITSYIYVCSGLYMYMHSCQAAGNGFLLVLAVVVRSWRQPGRSYGTDQGAARTGLRAGVP